MDKLSTKQKALERILAAVGKKHGDTLTTMAKGNIGHVLGAVPSPLGALNHYVLGPGGFAYERISEVFGPESSGKSSLVMGCLAEVQRAGGIGLYIDVENACTRERTDVLGVNKDELLMASDIDSAEEAFQLLLDTVEAHKNDVPLFAAYDSVPAMVTEAEGKSDVEDAHMSPMARVMSKFIPRLVKALRGKHAHVCFVNQIREKPGVMWGSPEYTPGGKALKFYATARLRTAGVKKRDGGLEVKVKCHKNKLGEPGREMLSFFHFQKGWDDAWTTLNLAKDLKLVPDATRDVRLAEKALAVAIGWRDSPADVAAFEEAAGKTTKPRGKKNNKEEGAP